MNYPAAGSHDLRFFHAETEHSDRIEGGWSLPNGGEIAAIAYSNEEPTFAEASIDSERSPVLVFCQRGTAPISLGETPRRKQWKVLSMQASCFVISGGESS